MRNRWNENPEYIVNLTKSALGTRYLEEIVFTDNRVNPNPERVYSYIRAAAWNKIQHMNDATLGRIIAYASAKGAHRDLRGSDTPPKFINVTGLTHVFGSVFYDQFMQMKIGQYIEEMAVGVITCVVFDMMMQESLQKQWLIWRELGVPIAL